MKARIAVMFGALALLANAPLNAQGHGAHGSGPLHLTLADGWHARLDRAADAGPEFTTMPPGWHVTSGPASILYDPATTARGDYRVESKIFLFDPGERREGFGIFIGGQNLDQPTQRYTYFVVRGTGEYLVRVRDGSDTRDVKGWTGGADVPKADGSGKATYKLTAQVGADSVRFMINDKTVTSVAKSAVPTDGIAGLRVNHNLHVMVSPVTVTTGGA